MPKSESEAGEFKTFLNQNKAKIKFTKSAYWAYIGLDDRGSDGTFKVNTHNLYRVHINAIIANQNIPVCSIKNKIKQSYRVHHQT